MIRKKDYLRIDPNGSDKNLPAPLHDMSPRQNHWITSYTFLNLNIFKDQSQA